MSTKTPHPQERIARELLTQSPTYIGTAGDVAVYWDSYEQTVAVVAADGDAETVALADTPFDTLGDYCDHIADARGWDTGPRVASSMADHVRQVRQ